MAADFAKVDFVGADLSLPDLGLGPARYDELLARADRVIHNAWPVNFNISVASFEPHVRGVRHLVDFAARAAKRVPVVFVSSISTVMAWPSAAPVPERRIDDLSVAGLGYGRSKLAGSLILDAAAARSGIPAASVRVGQIAGPRGRAGVWNRQEYLPSLIASSVHLGLLPSHLATGHEVDWTPVEDVAGLILDVAGVTARHAVADITGYFHAVNPARTTWAELAPVLADYYRGRIKKLVSFEDWLAALKRSGTADLDRNPAAKLVDMYDGMLRAFQAGHGHVNFAMERTMSYSPTVARLGPITPDLLRNWCDQWNY
ncbi:hypothetical protein CDD83_4170 [Cordyceps sp. RAO-2017]|nr:hypothetical protein CDD83_4170 [Cordyceps sp. RAO-2017]